MKIFLIEMGYSSSQANERYPVSSVAKGIELLESLGWEKSKTSCNLWDDHYGGYARFAWNYLTDAPLELELDFIP